MSNGAERADDRLRQAQEAYSGYLRDRRKGGDVDFQEFCREHSGLEEELRALHEVGQLARATASSRSFHDSMRERFPDADELTFSLTPDATLASGPPPPEEIALPRRAEEGRYVLEGVVARGGMGVIYSARDRDLNRTLAMKVMAGATGEEVSTDAVNRADLTRFLEEAQVTAQLDHPGIVPVHEVGFDSEGRLFFTMKMVKGRDLTEVFALVREEKEGWNLPRAVGVIVRVCQALAYAHAKQVIHRDLKPANIMAGRFGEVYVMDWGLAKIVGRKDLHDLRLRDDTDATYPSIRTDRRSAAESGADSPLITMDGSVVGTPAYMPPEQAKGLVEE